MNPLGEEFERLKAIMARLRGPDGCPWDRKQTFDTIRSHTLEETYEVIEAIDERDWPALRDELGDLLLQVMFYSRMAEEESLFSIADVVCGLADKLVRRHPHVFEDESGRRMNAEQALGRWNEMKAEEKGVRDSAGRSLLGDTPRGLPAILEAHKISVRAASAGFEWTDAEAILGKLDEEIEELRSELRSGVTSHERLESEVGDMFFTVVNVARKLGLEPESALKRTNRKFRRRFERMEEMLRVSGRTVKRSSQQELDRVWEQVKAEERAASRSDPAISNR